RRWPVKAEVRFGVRVRPAVEGSCQCGGLSAAAGQVLFQYEDQYHVAFGGEVRDILGNYRSALRPSEGRHMYVIGSLEADLGDVYRVVPIGGAQQLGRGHR